MKRTWWWKLCLLLATMVLFSTACGYSLAGRGSFLPDHIKTIGVPAFINMSAQPGAAEIFTEKVIEEFASRGKYVIKPDAAGVDAVLSGPGMSFTIAPQTPSGGGGQAS